LGYPFHYREFIVARNRDFIGQTFGLLTILNYAVDEKCNKRFLVQCSCGSNTKWSLAYSIKTGKTISCGCYRTEVMREVMTEYHKNNPSHRTHGKSGTKIYSVWTNMRERCSNPKHKDYSSYGGRGISVCSEWQESFEAFYADMGDIPNDCTLDRIQVESHYCKENCKWSTTAEQASNKRDSTYVIAKLTGEKLTLTGWAKRHGKNPRSERDTFYSMDLLGMTEYEDVTWEPGTFVNSYRRTQKAKSYDY
jgi:hypothetical protein